jgi:hypothetical protein
LSSKAGVVMAEGYIFIGPVVYVLAKKPSRGGMLEDVYLRRLGNQEFIVGKLADDGSDSDSQVGLTFWFAMNEVVMLTEYPDLERARNYYKEYKRRKCRK